MNHATAIAFPGQGGNWSATVRRLIDHRDHPLVRALRDRLDRDLQDLDGLDTRHAQPAVFVAGLVTAPDPSEAGLAVGHSMGEITAAAWAGAIEPVVGLDLLVTRAELGHRAHTDRPGAMVAVNRWDRLRVEELRRQAQFGSGGTLDVAVVNSESQIVLSGDESAVDLAVDLANGGGAVARRLPIGGAYHSTLMVGLVPAFREAVSSAVTSDPVIPVLSCTTAAVTSGADDLVAAIVGGLVGTVDWPRTVAALRTRFVSTIVDAGPGDTLVRLGRHLEGPPTVGR